MRIKMRIKIIKFVVVIPSLDKKIFISGLNQDW